MTQAGTATASSTAGARDRAPAVLRRGPGRWQLWTALGIVYVVWGSTYLAIRVMVDTMPPLPASAIRFMLAGLIMGVFVAARGGLATLKPTRAELVGCLVVGCALTTANGLVSTAEQEVPSALAALVYASIPLWVVLLRRVTRERVPLGTIGAVVLGFVGVAVLLRPGDHSDQASALALVTTVVGAATWATGTFLSPRVTLPRDAPTAVAWQMLLGGALLAVAGVVAGQGDEMRPSAFSGDSLIAFAYLVVFGSLLAFSAFTWVLQRMPVSKVTTYAYVNPVVAIALGWLILGETITPITLAGAAIIVGSVAIVVRSEASIDLR